MTDSGVSLVDGSSESALLSDAEVVEAEDDRLVQVGLGPVELGRG